MDYDNLRETALRLIGSFGNLGKATITRRIPGVYDPITDTDTGETFVTAYVKCVVLPAGDDEVSGKGDDLGTTDSLTMYLPYTYLPEVGDRVNLPEVGDGWSITQFKYTAPDGFRIYSKCRLERTGAG